MMKLEIQTFITNKNDSWRDNKTDRPQINRVRKYYEDNRLECIAKKKEYQSSLAYKMWKREYDQNYVKWRKSWGEYFLSKERREAKECPINLLNINGDIFTWESKCQKKYRMSKKMSK